MGKVAVESSRTSIFEDKLAVFRIGYCPGKVDIAANGSVDFDSTGIGDGPQIGVRTGRIHITFIELSGRSSENQCTILTDNEVLVIDENLFPADSFGVNVGPSAGFGVLVALSEVIEVHSTVVDGNGTAVDQTVVGGIGNGSPVSRAGNGSCGNCVHCDINLSSGFDQSTDIVGTGDEVGGSTEFFPIVSVVKVAVAGNVGLESTINCRLAAGGSVNNVTDLVSFVIPGIKSFDFAPVFHTGFNTGRDIGTGNIQHVIVTDFIVCTVSAAIVPFNIAFTFAAIESKLISIGTDCTSIEIENKVTAGMVVNIDPHIVIMDGDRTIVVQLIDGNVTDNIKSAALVDDPGKDGAFSTAVDDHVALAGQSDIAGEDAATENGDGTDGFNGSVEPDTLSIGSAELQLSTGINGEVGSVGISSIIFVEGLERQSAALDVDISEIGVENTADRGITDDRLDTVNVGIGFAGDVQIVVVPLENRQIAALIEVDNASERFKTGITGSRAVEVENRFDIVELTGSNDRFHQFNSAVESQNLVTGIDLAGVKSGSSDGNISDTCDIGFKCDTDTVGMKQIDIAHFLIKGQRKLPFVSSE